MKVLVGLFLLASCAWAGSADNAPYNVYSGIVYNYPARAHLKMELFTPNDGQAKHPAVLLIHGGSWLYGTRYQLDWYGKKLAAAGYVAATIDYRMMPRYAFPDCLYDCKLAVRFLRANADKYGIDPTRIAALGNSAGGHLAALLAATRPEDGFEGPSLEDQSSAVQTAVILYGVTDMSYYRDPQGYIRMMGFTSWFVDKFVTRGYKGTGNPYDAASPVHYADENMCPTMFLHGTKDNLVPYGQTIAFYENLRRLGVPTRLVTVNHGHAFDFFIPRTRKDILPDILNFLNEHLK